MRLLQRSELRTDCSIGNTCNSRAVTLAIAGSKLCSKIEVCRSLQYGVCRNSNCAWKILQNILRNVRFCIEWIEILKKDRTVLSWT